MSLLAAPFLLLSFSCGDKDDTGSGETPTDEHVWGYLKGLFRKKPLDRGERIDETVATTMKHIKSRRRVLRSLFGHPDLSYIKKNGMAP